MYGDPSLEFSHRDGSNEGSQCMFSLRNKRSYLRIIFVTPLYEGESISNQPTLFPVEIHLFFLSKRK